MPFIALKNEEKVIPEDISDNERVICPKCDENMTTVKSHRRSNYIVARHFRHISNSRCKGESEIHMKMKSIVASTLKYESDYKTSQIYIDSKMIGNRQPDILLEFQGNKGKLGNGIAFECQWKNKNKDIEGVTKEYVENGYSVIWLDESHFDNKSVRIKDGSSVPFYPTSVLGVNTEIQSQKVAINSKIEDEYESEKYIKDVQEELKTRVKATVDMMWFVRNQITEIYGKRMLDILDNNRVQNIKSHHFYTINKIGKKELYIGNKWETETLIYIKGKSTSKLNSYLEKAKEYGIVNELRSYQKKMGIEQDENDIILVKEEKWLGPTIKEKIFTDKSKITSRWISRYYDYRLDVNPNQKSHRRIRFNDLVVMKIETKDDEYLTIIPGRFHPRIKDRNRYYREHDFEEKYYNFNEEHKQSINIKIDIPRLILGSIGSQKREKFQDGNGKIYMWFDDGKIDWEYEYEEVDSWISFQKKILEEPDFTITLLDKPSLEH